MAYSEAMTTSRRVVKTYLGKGRSRRTVWAVREYITEDVYETIGTYADQATAEAHR